MIELRRRMMVAQQDDGPYLYRRGNQCSQKTGGWRNNDAMSNGFVLASDRMCCAGYGACGVITTDNAIDLTRVTTLHFVVSCTFNTGNQNVWIGALVNKNDYLWSTGAARKAVISTGGAEREYTLDVSSLSGLYYVAVSYNISIQYVGNATVYEVWME